jgi:hypothetical protein
VPADATAQFFANLEQHPHQPLLLRANGSLRFEVSQGKTLQKWRVEVHHGDVSVSHRAGSDDCVVRGSKEMFDRLVTGRENALAATLRGALDVEGNPELLQLFQRILPGPPQAKERRRAG